jgi:hypothetical protein
MDKVFGERYVSIPDFSKIFSISTKTVRSLIVDRKIPYVTIGKAKRIPLRRFCETIQAKSNPQMTVDEMLRRTEESLDKQS